MQRVEKKMLSVQKNLQRKNIEAAVTEAKEIEELYGLMLAYFENRQDAEKGIAMFKNGRDAAAQMVAHASAGNVDGAQEAAKLIARDCRGCHREYKPLD
jgi:cytochrome c556